MTKPKSKKPTVLKVGGLTFKIAPPPPSAPPEVFSDEANACVDSLRADCEAAPDRRVSCIDFLVKEQRFTLRGSRGGKPAFDFRIKCVSTERDDPLLSRHVLKTIDLSGDHLRRIVDGLLHKNMGAVDLEYFADTFAGFCDANRMTADYDRGVEAARARRL